MFKKYDYVEKNYPFEKMLLGLVIPTFTVGILALVYDPAEEWTLSYIDDPFLGVIIFLVLSMVLLFLVMVHVWALSLGIIYKSETVAGFVSCLMVVYGMYGIWDVVKNDGFVTTVWLWFGLVLWGWSLMLGLSSKDSRVED